MMHLPDRIGPQELQVKNDPDGKTYIGPPGLVAGAQDREILAFDGQTLVTRFVEPKADARYGKTVYARCTPRT